MTPGMFIVTLAMLLVAAKLFNIVMGEDDDEVE